MMMEGHLLIKFPKNWINMLRERVPLEAKVLDVVPFDSEGTRDLVEITLTSKEHALEDVEKALKELPGIEDVEITPMDSTRALIAVSVKKCQGCRILRDSDCFLVSATTQPDGWIEWTLIFTKKSALQKLVFSLRNIGCGVRLKKVANIEEETMLTPKQEEIIKVAYEKGYYDFPKKIGIRELAEMFNISTATLSEVLRRGQKKIIEHYLYMHGKKS